MKAAKVNKKQIRLLPQKQKPTNRHNIRKIHERSTNMKKETKRQNKKTRKPVTTETNTKMIQAKRHKRKKHKDNRLDKARVNEHTKLQCFCQNAKL